MKALVRDSGQDNVQPGFLRPIDTGNIARLLDLDALAEDRGRENLPSSDVDELDNVEQAIVQKIESEWAWQGDELVNQLRGYATRLVQFSIKSEFEKLQLTANNALSRLRNDSHRAEADLGPLREYYIGARDELEHFKERHRLKRPARPQARRWTTIGLMVVLMGAESALNGSFFAKGSEGGYLGGIGTAIGISVVNVVSSFFLGLFPVRWLHRRNVLLKFSGLVLSAGGLVGLVCLQAFAAHFREAMAAVGEALAMRAAIESLTTAPFQLTDINSFYLFGLGLLFSLAAFWKGYRFDDPYPGYGPATRRRDAGRQAYSDAHADLFDELEEIKDETVAALQDGVGLLPKFPQTAADIRAKRAALLQQFRGYETSVGVAANQLLARYRDTNRRHRTTPPPRHFDEAWKLPHSFIEGPQVATLMTDVPETAVDVDGPLTKLNELSTALLREYEALLTKYPHPTQMA